MFCRDPWRGSGRLRFPRCGLCAVGLSAAVTDRDLAQTDATDLAGEVELKVTTVVASHSMAQ